VLDSQGWADGKQGRKAIKKNAQTRGDKEQGLSNEHVYMPGAPQADMKAQGFNLGTCDWQDFNIMKALSQLSMLLLLCKQRLTIARRWLPHSVRKLTNNALWIVGLQ